PAQDLLRPTHEPRGARCASRAQARLGARLPGRVSRDRGGDPRRGVVVLRLRDAPLGHRAGGGLGPVGGRDPARVEGPAVRAALAILAAALVAVPAADAYRNPTSGKAVVLQIKGMHRAKVKRGIVYQRSPRLRMDVYRPQKARGRLPAVL